MGWFMIQDIDVITAMYDALVKKLLLTECLNQDCVENV